MNAWICSIIHLYICVCTYTYIYMCVCMYVCIYVCMYVRICINMSIHEDVRIFSTCTYTCVYTPFLSFTIFLQATRVYTQMTYTQIHICTPCYTHGHFTHLFAHESTPHLHLPWYRHHLHAASTYTSTCARSEGMHAHTCDATTAHISTMDHHANSGIKYIFSETSKRIEIKTTSTNASKHMVPADKGISFHPRKSPPASTNSASLTDLPISRRSLAVLPIQW